jgi:hypothetical protein
VHQPTHASPHHAVTGCWVTSAPQWHTAPAIKLRQMTIRSAHPRTPVRGSKAADSNQSSTNPLPQPLWPLPCPLPQNTGSACAAALAVTSATPLPIFENSLPEESRPRQGACRHLAQNVTLKRGSGGSGGSGNACAAAFFDSRGSGQRYRPACLRCRQALCRNESSFLGLGADAPFARFAPADFLLQVLGKGFATFRQRRKVVNIEALNLVRVLVFGFPFPPH